MQAVPNTHPCNEAPNTPQTVSLVLGSGGARGLAHIGIIQWLEENNFIIQSVAGSSMGALIGGIYATGKLGIYTEWVRALTKADVLFLLDFSFRRAGLIKGERIISLLKKIICDCQIESLPISFTAVATDVENGKEVWLNRGSLFDAIRASIAIPTFFTPHEYQGRRLLDGGLVNPVPIAPTLKDFTDLTVVVNVNGKEPVAYKKNDLPITKEPPQDSYVQAIKRFIQSFYPISRRNRPEEWGIFDVLNHSLDTMQSTIARLKLAAYTPDIIIEIPKNTCGTFEFHRADEMIALGRMKAQEIFSSIYDSSKFNGS